MVYLSLYKIIGIPIAEGLDSASDLPHTLTQAILYRAKIDSLKELPKDKQPPRNLWDKPFLLGEYLDEVWDSPEEKAARKGKEYIEINADDMD